MPDLKISGLFALLRLI